MKKKIHCDCVVMVFIFYLAALLPAFPGDLKAEDREPLPCIDNERQEYDPYCRTEQEQMIDYMDDILGENPYTIVDVG